MAHSLPWYCLLLASITVCCEVSWRQAQATERLNRGLVAMRCSATEVYVGWRLLKTDPAEIGFYVYRISGHSEPVRLNDTPIVSSTNFVDRSCDPAQGHRYFVREVLEGREGERSPDAVIEAGNAPREYFEVRLATPPGYSPGDTAPGDLDGDGNYELVVHMTGRGRDNSQPGLTDPPILHAYRLDGTLLWSIQLGRNIREGAHYTQFLVFDLDGDHAAEVVCKTADGTIDGTGEVLGNPEANWVGEDGRILEGPERLTVFDGRTGAARDTVDYVPPRGDLAGWGGIGGNGGNDRIGNRADRFLACVAFLDGQHPSAVMCRGYYGRSVLAAWDFQDGKLRSRWVFDTAVPGRGKDGRAHADYSGMGGHSLAVVDVDEDGRDEIIYHSMVVDDDGQGLYTTGLRHGDALHASRFHPNQPNPIVFGIHENEGSRWDATTPALAAFDARTGKTVWRTGDGLDASRGLAADIDPRFAGAEMWSDGRELRTCLGEVVGRAPRSANFAVWWDGDLLRELLDRTTISKWNWEQRQLEPLLVANECGSINGSKATPMLSVDLLGDWREEVVFRTLDQRALRIYSTTIPTDHRLITLMHDRQYRLAVATQNVGYNQPPHPSFFLGHGMTPHQPTVGR